MNEIYEEHIIQIAKELKRRHYKSTDKDKIKKKFGFDEEWAEATCKELKKYEQQ